MSRATRMRVFIVSGLRPLTSSAQASDALRSAPVDVMATAAAKPPADLCRKPRRDKPPFADAVSFAVMGVSSSFSLICRPLRLPVAPELLQHLDLIAVGIVDEEESPDPFPVAVEFDDLAR